MQAFVIPVTQESEAEGVPILDVSWVKHNFKASSNSLANPASKQNIHHEFRIGQW